MMTLYMKILITKPATDDFRNVMQEEVFLALPVLRELTYDGQHYLKFKYFF